MHPQTPTGPDRIRLLAAGALAGWAAAVLAEAVAVAADHAAGGRASELRDGATAGLALALAVPWDRCFDRPQRVGPPRPVRGALALGLVAAAVLAAVAAVLPPEGIGAAAGAGVLGLLGAFALAAAVAMTLAPGAAGATLASLAGAGIAGLALPWSGSFASACHAGAAALASASWIVLRSSRDLRAVTVARLPGTGSPWSGAIAAACVVAVVAGLPWFGPAPFARPWSAVLTACILLGLAASVPGRRPRGAALAAGLLLAHVLGLGGDPGLRTVSSGPGRGMLGRIDGAECEVRVLQRCGSQSLVYDRGTQELAVLDGSVRVDGHGPDRNHGALAGLVAACLADPGSAVRVHDCLQAAEVLRTLGGTGLSETVADPARIGLGVRARGHGPVSLPGAHVDQSVTAVHGGHLRRELRAAAPGALGALVTGVPGMCALHAADPLFHAEARRALGNGLLLVPMPLDRVPPALVRATCAAAWASHPHVELLLVRDVLLLVAGAAPIAWTKPGARRPAAGSWWWSVGAADPADLGRARIDVKMPTGPAPVADALQLAAACGEEGSLQPHERRCATAAFLRSVVARGDAHAAARIWLRDRAVDRDALATEAALQIRAEHEGSHLLHDELQQSRIDAASALVCGADPADPASVHRAAVAASSWCHVGAPRAVLQAALGLPSQGTTSVHDPADAARTALAIDPTLASAPPAVLQRVFGALAGSAAGPATGALEDFAHLPGAHRLAALCTGATPLATALRTRFGPACAEALLAVRRERPWTHAEAGALRELASIAIVDAASDQLGEQGCLEELLCAWRLDLPVSRGIERLLRSAPPARLALAGALPRRKDPRAVRALAALLVDDDLQVRIAAGAALDRSWPGAVPYDPSWQRSRLEEAARALLAMHNRRP